MLGAGVVVVLLAAGGGAWFWLRPAAPATGGATPRRGADGPPRLEVPPSLQAQKAKADAGDAGAMRFLGTCYANGLGVSRDLDEAKRWFRKAAEAGSQAAKEELANLER